MRIFLDTEYTNPTNKTLISLGLITEDGKHSLYIESREFVSSECNAFVRQHVITALSPDPMFALNRAQIAESLHRWFAERPRSVTIACDSPIDFALFESAAQSLPPNVAPDRYDLRALIDDPDYHRSVELYHASIGHPWHHALHDAAAHRQGFLSLMSKRSARRRLGG
jgi:hypothetical protein